MPPECRRCLRYHPRTHACRLDGIDGRLRNRVEQLTATNRTLRQTLEAYQGNDANAVDIDGAGEAAR